jgi:hypothetical protein
MSEINDIWMDAIADDPEIPAWKRLDIVTRKWAVLSAFEKDQDMYQKLRDNYNQNVML